MIGYPHQLSEEGLEIYGRSPRQIIPIACVSELTVVVFITAYGDIRQDAFAEAKKYINIGNIRPLDYPSIEIRYVPSTERKRP